MTAQQAAAFLRTRDRFLILTHQFPDGDTLGSAFALCLALQALGKQARVGTVGPLPARYAFLAAPVPAQPDFEPETVCAVDVADRALLGEENARLYGERVALNIDHHGTARAFAAQTLCRPVAAACMLVREVIGQLGVPLTPAIADCLYTGLATDTGCFRYSNTTAEVFLLAAELTTAGARTEEINRLMFETKPRGMSQLEQAALQSLHYALHGRVALMAVTRAMLQESGLDDSQVEGLAAVPRQIEGVWVGLTFREKPDGGFKISIRTGPEADAAAIGAALGGGGHLRAAGCSLELPLEQAQQRLLDVVAAVVPEITL